MLTQVIGIAAGRGAFASEDVMENYSSKLSAGLSRRALLTGGVVASSALLLASKASATARLSHEAVHFETTASSGHNCGACKHFLAPSSCRFVEGSVSSGCSCWIWASKVA
jgi:hypothetical protein